LVRHAVMPLDEFLLLLFGESLIEEDRVDLTEHFVRDGKAKLRVNNSLCLLFFEIIVFYILEIYSNNLTDRVDERSSTTSIIKISRMGHKLSPVIALVISVHDKFP